MEKEKTHAKECVEICTCIVLLGTQTPQFWGNARLLCLALMKNDERYSELRQDFLVFQEQNFADPRFVFCGNCSHVICRRLFVGGEFM